MLAHSRSPVLAFLGLRLPIPAGPVYLPRRSATGYTGVSCPSTNLLGFSLGKQRANGASLFCLCGGLTHDAENAISWRCRQFPIAPVPILTNVRFAPHSRPSVRPPSMER